MAKAITFVVPGQDQSRLRGAERSTGSEPLPNAFARGQVTHSVRVRAERAGGADVLVTAVPDQDVVALHLANGPTLYLHAESARDLLRAQSARPADREAGAEDPDMVKVPVQLGWRRLEQAGATRGAARGLGDVLLSVFEVIREPAAKLAAGKIVQLVDEQVNEGVYQLAQDRLDDLLEHGRKIDAIPAAGDQPILVFIHGTFSTTKGTFAKLWDRHPLRVQELFDHYGNRVYALDHRTLGASPIANALTLAKALPKGAPIHLVTHSRGGLVAEVLARACASPAPAVDFDGLAELVEHAKGVNIQRVMRVACPARGTLLASRRLDAYLSVFRWALQLANVPVAPQLMEFLAAVAQRRHEPGEIPGLAAQIPDSPLVQWLHSPTEPIPGELRVVAGDLEGDSVSSWLKTTLSDLFYRTDHDLVVQTSSMYGGAPREHGASFVFDQGGRVSHFRYFENELTAGAIVDGIIALKPHGFRNIGPLSWEGKSQTGDREAPRSTGPDPAMPAVFVLPGILGSNLKLGNDRIWLSFRIVFGLARLAYTPGDGIDTDGAVKRVYKDLIQYLSATHEVIEFPFDWRKPIEEEAARLASAVEEKLDARQTTGKPVRLLAHSMGGLVARAMQLKAPEIWKRMIEVKDARFLMLGTPNGGSWAPMQVLSGDDSFGNMLVGFGAPFRQKEARQLMAAMPGFIQLQAKLTDEAFGLHDEATWRALGAADAKAVESYSLWHNDPLQTQECEWGVPPQKVLDAAVRLREELDRQIGSNALAPDPLKVLLVVGKSGFTPDGYELDPDKGLVYLDARDAGDGRVTLESARLPGVHAWALDCEHGSMPQAKHAFEAYLELLENGTTAKLPALEAISLTRGETRVAAPVVHVRSRRSRIPVLARPPQTEKDVLDATDRRAREGAAPAVGAVLEVRVLNANLAFVRPPLLIGHYRSERLTGTEWVMDSLIGGEMQDALTVGNYPSAPGTYGVFPNNRENPDDERRLPRPAAVVVVGLGEEGELRGSDLVESVRKGAIAAARWASRDPKNMPHFELASTLIGSGGPGISAGQAAQLVAQGVREANVALLQLDGKWPLVGKLLLVELYLDRAAEALRALETQRAAAPALFRVKPNVRRGPGALRRTLEAGYRGTTYDYIRAVAHKDSKAKEEEAIIEYTLDTRRARTEVRTQKAQSALVRELSRASTRDAIDNKALGTALFRLLVPVDLEPYLGGTMEMVIELERETAGIPWELMDAPNSGDSRPWALRSKLLRKLRIKDFRPQVTDAGKGARVLIIGEPRCDPPYLRLPGARREAHAVFKSLTESGRLPTEQVTTLIAPDDERVAGATFSEIITTLQSGTWRILHISGHGKKPEDDRASAGVVLSNKTFLGATEINALRPVPELVFVNCCHLGAAAPDEVMNYSRPEFAASVAEALIRIGVRCVVAAGWAVADDIAEVFAQTFYDRLLAGDRFMDAVARAREEAHSMGGNTWAAYQCYGDPNWTLDLEAGDAQNPRAVQDAVPSKTKKKLQLNLEFAGVSSAPALILALETIAIDCQSRMPKPDMEEQRTRLGYLESMHRETWGREGAVAEAFANAWKHAEHSAKAIEWYGRALTVEDGGASMKAMEQYENVRVRAAAERVLRARREASGEKFRTIAVQAAEEVSTAIRQLEKLWEELPHTMERANLCGSANKRLAIIHEACDKPSPQTIEQVRKHYAVAEQLGTASPRRFYPALNVMAVDILTRPGGVADARFTEVRDMIAARQEDSPDFWSAAGSIELRLYEALQGDGLESRLAELVGELRDLRKRWPSPWMWQSVRDQARFVLPHYGRRAPSAEDKEAAAALLEELEGYAGNDARGRASTPPVKRKKASPARNSRQARARKS